jgi:dsRNA-specific ribonuclease
MRSYLVRNSTLAHFSRLYDLPANLRISPTNYTAASIKDNYSTAADVLEAYVWGVQLDHGFPRCQRWVNGLYKTLLDPLYQDLGGKGEFHMSPAQQFRWLDKHDMQGRSAH